MYADQPCGRFRLSPLCVAHQPHSHNPDWGGTPGGKTTVPRWLNVLAIPRRGEKDAPLFENVDSTFASSGGGAGAEKQPPTLLPLPLLLPRRRLQKRHPLALPRGRCRRSACFRCRRLTFHCESTCCRLHCFWGKVVCQTARREASLDDL